MPQAVSSYLRLHSRLALISILTWLLLTAVTPALSADGERITSFNSAITVNHDATLTITETIMVKSNADQIIHGIVREFPLTYTDEQGTMHAVDFRIDHTGLNGGEVPHHVESFGGSINVYLGDADIELAPGRYEYTLKYTTANHLRPRGNHLLLYYNVTGTDWDFPIDKAAAKVTLPTSFTGNTVTMKAYTGPAGSTQTDCKMKFTGGDTCSFTATRPFDLGENLTIMVQFPAGTLPVTPATTLTNSSVPSTSMDWDEWLLLGVMVLVVIGIKFGTNRYRGSNYYDDDNSSSSGSFFSGSSGGGSGGGGGGGW